MNLLNHIGAELLHGQRANVASELSNNGITETVVVQVEDVLYHLSKKAWVPT